MAFDVLPTKATKSGRGRRLVYLDQNVVTELAKLRLGRLKDDDDRTDALRELSVALHAAVFERQDARCVESTFHHGESSGLVVGGRDPVAADELFREIREFLATHSWGLQFDTLQEVTRFQAMVTHAAEAGLLEYERGYLWKGAFHRNPNQSNERAGVRVGRDTFVLSIPWQPQVIDVRGWAERLEGVRGKGPFASFDDALAALRAELRARDSEDNRRFSWAHLWGDHDAPMAPETIAAFIGSDAYGEIPVNDVLTRVGARVLSDPRRPLKDSDAVDMRVMALALPYCDLVVTDSHMASVVTGLHLDEKYGAKVLSAGNEGLRLAAAWLAPPAIPAT